VKKLARIGWIVLLAIVFLPLIVLLAAAGQGLKDAD
jgi:hypothetical protein